MDRLSCTFPVLHTGFDGQDGYASLEFSNLIDKNAVRGLRRGGGGEIDHIQLFQLAWALVLRVYTGSDQPAFSMLDDNAVVENDKIVGANFLTVDLSDDLEIGRLLEMMQVIRSSSDGKGLNTAIKVSGSVEFSFEKMHHTIVIDVDLKAENCGARLWYRHSVLRNDQAWLVAETLAHVVKQLTMDKRPSSVEYCSRGSMEQLQKWNLEEPKVIERCIHDFIVEQCQRQPNASAVCSWDGNLTYGELDRLSSHIASRLLDLGVGPNSFVGLYFEKSKWMTVALLAVLRSGGAYVFLDPSFPGSRLQEMCKQTNALVVLSSERLKDDADTLAPVVMVIDQSWQDMVDARRSCSAPLPRPAVRPSDAAYAVFSSGSTGKPKGAVIAHSSYCSGQIPFNDFVGLGPTSRVMQSASYAFDLSNYEHLTPLMFGSCICVPSKDVGMSALAEAARDMEVNHLALTPTVVRLLKPSDIPKLKTIILVGEPPSLNDVSTWAGHCRLINGYGPCECTTFTSAHQYKPQDNQPTNIGRGFGARCWITDAANPEKLVPVGAIGELIIEGPIVGNGYIDNATLNEQAFIEYPKWRRQFSGAKRGRMYRTGDLAQFVCEGELRYLGRNDSQAKLRGQRLEMSGVEHHLQSLLGEDTQVLGEIVVPKDASDGSPVLVAFVHFTSRMERDLFEQDKPSSCGLFAAPRAEFRHEAQLVLSQMSKLVPAYMVPSLLLEVNFLPTTPSGKADRKRLREEARLLTRRQMESFRTQGDAERQLPSSPMEQTLFQLVKDVLNVKDFGMNESFLHLGGDSVLAMRLSRLAREEAGLDLSVGAILGTPILSDLALRLTTNLEEVTMPAFALIDVQVARKEILEVAQAACALASSDEVEDVYPCTPLQEAMMALSMARNQPTYIIRTVFLLPRWLDMDRFKDAWATVIWKNPILRTRIIQHGKFDALQVVVKKQIEWKEKAAIADAVREESQETMRLGEELMRLTVVDESSSKRYLIFTIHHALTDGWSLQQTLGQVEAAYHGEKLAPQPFKRFIHFLSQSDKETTNSFWKNQLEDFHGLHFPSPVLTDGSYRPTKIQAVRTSVGVRPPKGAATTLANSIQLSWALTLSQYSGSHDVVFGCTVSGRDAPLSGIDKILGPTLATIPLRVRLDRNLPVAVNLERLHKTLASATTHAHLGLQRIATLSAGAAAACGFQSLLIIQPWEDDGGPPSVFGKEEDSYGEEIVDSYVLTLEVKLTRDGTLHILMQHDTNILPAEFMSSITRQFIHNLMLVTQDSEARLGDLPAVNPSDLGMIQIWNNHLPESFNCCIHDIVERHAKGHPDRLAVDAWDGKLTYGRLDEVADILCARIRGYSSGPGSFVLIYLGKSMWTAVAIFAVLKAGAGFVLVDPALPINRMQQICEAVKAETVLASEQYWSKSTALGLNIVSINDDILLESSCDMASSVTLTPDDVAYVVFTSGSTGKPKGVVIQHRAFLTSALINGGKQHIDSSSRVVHLASHSFDSSIAEFLYTLTHGGCVCIPSEKESRNDLEKALNRYRVTWATLTPSLARAVDPPALTTLQTLALGGEAMTQQDVDMWSKHVRLVNGYGPAESCVDALIQPLVGVSADCSNIGRSFAGAAWVVDPNDHHLLCPIGAPGELVLEGPTLAKGYLNDPDKTDASFVEYPSWLAKLRAGRPLGRLYKTGDVVQYSPVLDGTIQYLGRQDSQVKLRGQRIELTEVEHHVRDCVRGCKGVVAEIITPNDGGARPMLVAFILLASQCNAASSENLLAGSVPPGWDHLYGAEDLLRSRVPSYMVPAAFVPLSRLPVNANGKTDRRALRTEAEKKSRNELHAYTSSIPSVCPPQSAEEIALNQAVCRVLELSSTNTSMQSNFFHLGGDSITAMKIVGLLRESGYSLSMEDVFTTPQLQQLATRLTISSPHQPATSYTPFSLLPQTPQQVLLQGVAEQCGVDLAMIEDAYPCTPMQESLVASSMKVAGSYMATMCFRTGQDIDIDRLQTAWEAVYEANAVLRTRFIIGEANEIIQVVLKDQLQWSTDPNPPEFSLGKHLFKITSNQADRKLLLHMHHALYDGVSLDLILEQVKSAYQGQQLKPTQFTEFVGFTLKVDKDACSSFWKKEFENMDAANFPSRRHASRSVSERETFSHNIPLPDMSKCDYTMSTIAHMAIATIVGHYTSAVDVLYGTTLSGRNAAVKGIEAIVGPTITTVPLRARLLPHISVSDNLREMQRHFNSLTQHEQTSLSTIRSLDADTAAACDFGCHVVIQPPDVVEDSDFEFLKTLDVDIIETQKFASYPLVLVLTPSADKRTLNVMSNVDMAYMGSEGITRFFHHFHHVFHQLVRNPNQLLNNIEVISPHDLEQLAIMNKTVPATADKTLHQLIYEWCAVQPQSPAVSAWDGSLSYEMLCRFSSLLARHLTATCGIKRGTVVICMEKSCWTIVAMLATLVTGSACALVDPSHPQARIRDIIQQTKPNCVMVSPRTANIVSDFPSVIEVSRELLQALVDYRKEPVSLEPVVAISDIAMIFFTSGSSGKPKGIMLEHSALTTSLLHLKPEFRLSNDSRVLHFASYAFDIATLEVLSALTSGGCVCIPSDEDRTANLVAFVQDQLVNTAFMTPTSVRFLEGPAAVPGLKVLALGGEPLTSGDVNRWAEHLRLVNSFGPAECSYMCVTDVPSVGTWSPGTIGSTVNNCLTWIVDPSDPMKLAAWGAIGELLVQGPILARGYLGDAEKTGLSFIHDPPWLVHFDQTEKQSVRLYRTGDLVQYTEEGQMRFIGRRDTQVKLRGQRIELGEIETQLKILLPVDAMCVVEVASVGLTNKSKILAAFIFLGHEETPGEQRNGALPLLSFISPDDLFCRLCRDIVARISTVLPPYMIPQDFFQLSYMPETGTGKVDRRLIVQSASASDIQGVNSIRNRHSDRSPPTTDSEKRIAGLWSQVLNLPTSAIHADDNFFHLGGDSVHAVKLVSLARKNDIQLSVSEIFACPMLSDMAALASSKVPAQACSAAIEPFSLLHTSSIADVKAAAAKQCRVALEKIEDVYPCTPLQEGLVSQSLKRPGSYVGEFNFRLPKSIDMDRFRNAWVAVGEANPILRTRFIVLENLLQVVVSEELSVVFAKDLDQVVFPLTTGILQLGQSMIHLVVVPIPGGSSLEFRLAIHHSLYDAWSINLILDQVALAYELQQVRPPSFTRFIRHALSAPEKAQSYWRDQLQGFNGVSFPSGAVPSNGHYTGSFIKGEATLMPINDFTGANILQLAWALVLSIYTDSKDVVYGLVLSGRNADIEGIDEITGPTLTTVPLRVVLKEDQTVIAELGKLKSQMSSMTVYEQFGLRNIKAIGRDAEAVCQFQNLLLIQAAGKGSPAELWANPAAQPHNAGDFSTYALEVTCDVSDGLVEISFDFDGRKLHSSQAQRVLGMFIHVIECLQKQPSEPLSGLDYLGENDWLTIQGWNSTLPPAVNKCVHRGIEEKCVERPEATAVHAWDGIFTYKDIDELSLMLALHLQESGVGPEVVIPILGEKTRWIAIAILGVVRAGGAVVLLEPTIPAERLQTIVKSVGAKMIVATESCKDLAQKFAPIVVDIDQRLSSSQQLKTAANLVRDVTPRNALYVIFTSGSTGKPKGILVEHQAFYTSGLAQQDPLRINSSMRTLQFASHMFDVSVADYLWTFLAGGCVCVASQDMLRNDLKGAINDLRVNRMDLTPSVARTLRYEDIPGMKTLLLGGEPMTQIDIAAWAGKVELVNGYGPSECSVCCILADVDTDSDPANIGQAYGIVPWVVDKDDHSKLVPIGAIGELVLEGFSLARGYIDGDAKATAAFVEKMPPWLCKLRPQSRLYKTGDLVQYGAEGSIKYIGRKDTQVKIRGQRVELGEIEQYILQSGSLVQNVVVELLPPEAGTSGQSSLVAFIHNHTSSNGTSNGHTNGFGHSLFYSPTIGQRESCQGIRSVLQQHLPEYMIPTFFFPLKYVPLSPSGKVDRRRLKDEVLKLSRKNLAPYQTTSVMKRAPRTEREQLLQSVVAKTLHLSTDDVGMDDNFFQLGGDSIVALHFVEHARQHGFSFQVTTVFQTPKLSDLASNFANPPSINLEQTNNSGHLKLPDKETASKALGNCPVDDIDMILPVSQNTSRFLLVAPEYWILNLTGPVDHKRLHAACEKLVERHIVLRSIFVHNDNGYAQVVLRGTSFDIPHYETSLKIFDFVEDYRLNDDIVIPTVGALVTQFFLVSRSPEEKALVLRLSHAQFDGYSLHVLWNDLKSIYENIALPAPANFASHMQLWAMSKTDEAYAFWRRTLEGSQVSRIKNSTFDACIVNGKSSARGSFVTTTQQVNLFNAPMGEVTVATIVKTAWACTLAELTGQSDVVFTQAVNGRSISDSTKNVVGPCLNLIPVRVELKSGGSYLELMKFVQRQHHQSVPYELLDFREIAKRSTSWSNATHQSMLVHQNIGADVPFTFGEATAQVECSYHWEHPPDEILIESRPVGEGVLQLTLDTTTDILRQEHADATLSKLCSWLVTLMGQADEKVRINGCT